MEDISFFTINYPTMPIEEISNKLNRTIGALHQKAHRLHIEKIIDSSNINFLLGDDLNTFYWVGFLLADGCFLENSTITVSSAKIDYQHLEKFALLSNSKIHDYTHNGNNYGQNGIVYHSLACFDMDIVPKIREKFDIHLRKTYNPPDYNKYDFSNDQIMALIVGFIDGDGYVNINYKHNYSKYKISIQLHSSWFKNLEYINNILHAHINTLPKNKVYIDKRGYASLYIGKREILQDIKKFIIKHDLPVLERKWSKIII